MRKAVIALTLILLSAAAATVVVIHEPRTDARERDLSIELAAALCRGLASVGVEAVGAREFTSSGAAAPGGGGYLLLTGEIVSDGDGYYDYRWTLLDTTERTLALGEISARWNELADSASSAVAREIRLFIDDAGYSTPDDGFDSPLHTGSPEGSLRPATLVHADSLYQYGPFIGSDDTVELRRHPLYELDKDGRLTIRFLHYELLNRGETNLRSPVFFDPVATEEPAALSASVLPPNGRLRWRAELTNGAPVHLSRTVVRLDGPAGPEYAQSLDNALIHYSEWAVLTTTAGFHPATAAPGAALVGPLEYDGRPVLHIEPDSGGDLYALVFDTPLNALDAPLSPLLELLGGEVSIDGGAEVAFRNRSGVLHYGSHLLNDTPRRLQALVLDETDGSYLLIFLDDADPAAPPDDGFTILGDWAAHLLP